MNDQWPFRIVISIKYKTVTFEDRFKYTHFLEKIIFIVAHIFQH